jgi:hypothetical protein
MMNELILFSGDTLPRLITDARPYAPSYWSNAHLRMP